MPIFHSFWGGKPTFPYLPIDNYGFGCSENVILDTYLICLGINKKFQKIAKPNNGKSPHIYSEQLLKKIRELAFSISYIVELYRVGPYKTKSYRVSRVYS